MFSLIISWLAFLRLILKFWHAFLRLILDLWRNIKHITPTICVVESLPCICIIDLNVFSNAPTTTSQMVRALGFYKTIACMYLWWSRNKKFKFKWCEGLPNSSSLTIQLLLSMFLPSDSFYNSSWWWLLQTQAHPGTLSKWLERWHQKGKYLLILCPI